MPKTFEPTRAHEARAEQLAEEYDVTTVRPYERIDGYAVILGGHLDAQDIFRPEVAYVMCQTGHLCPGLVMDEAELDAARDRALEETADLLNEPRPSELESELRAEYIDDARTEEVA